MNYLIRTYVFVLLSFVSIAAYAEDTLAEKLPNWAGENLTGDWGGSRAELYKKGIDIGLTHKSDVLSNINGGIKRGTAWEGHTEARLTLDLEKVLGLNATTIYLHYHSDLGSKFNNYYVGSFLGVDNIEVAENTAQFYHAWIQKNFADDSISLLAGIYPIDSEFYVTETSGLFLGPSYGMANELAQTGKNGPPVFPLGTPAVRVKLTSPDKNFYVQGAVTNGMPGNPNSHSGTQIKLDGSLKIVEFGWTPQSETPVAKAEEEVEVAETFHKTAVGFWRYSSRFDDLSDIDGNGNPVRRHSQGAYLLTEHSLYTEPDHPAQGLSGFFRLGFASEDIHQVDWTSSIGFRYHGLFEGRDDDIAGAAITLNHASDKYKLLNTSESHETDLELTYRAQIKPWLALQPSLQVIVHPNMDKTVDDAWVLGLRTEIEF
ncbi:MAG: carbohydrate porin [Methylophilales bacterium]|nr:carbohydrate porin [Methylophilales bacterium]